MMGSEPLGRRGRRAAAGARRGSAIGTDARGTPAARPAPIDDRAPSISLREREREGSCFVFGPFGAAGTGEQATRPRRVWVIGRRTEID